MSAYVWLSLAAVDADAATRIKHDKRSEVRFVLDGRTLTVAIVDLPSYSQSPPTIREVSGRQIRVACGTSFRRYARTTVVARPASWPRGARSLEVRFRRDISRRVKWCVLERTSDGGDVAVVSFLKAESRHVLDRGHFEDGTRWRFFVWRSERLEPCVGVGVAKVGSLSTCFFDDAEDEARLSVTVIRPKCKREAFAVGAVARSVETVTISLADGSDIAATVYQRPEGSRVRAKYFMAPLADEAQVARILARDGLGQVVGRETHPDRFGSAYCASSPQSATNRSSANSASLSPAV
ncbi:MAG TPA: hypothetical protein VFQ14_04850 [Thermoleophilaceae bacterium]|nr:hypothetical protein [Thermoleophilaceae bacterium]